ncbi:unnamed protein product [marine sediment metagenome]|uniref:Nucleotide-diphospho-sugar transferase domain-containing protein n=1 Tax=marine sediment metagenome TaxID=412755 RepID=X0WEH8_9ZZZZ
MEKTSKEGFDRVAMLPPRVGKHWFLDSVRYFGIVFDLLEGYDTCLFMDSDLNFIEPFPELFRMTERFDVVAAMGSRRITVPTVETIPPCFPEYELGLILFRRNAIVRKFFDEWQRLHFTYHDVYGNNDQGSFREAVWNTPDLKIDRIPDEYALRWPFGVFMSHTVKILHGREEIDRNIHPEACSLDNVRNIVNEHTEMRVWSPRSKRWSDGVIPGAGWPQDRTI